MKMVCGLVRPTSGRVLVDGVDVVRSPLEAKRALGYVPDRPSLYEKLTAFEYVRFVGGLYALPAAEVERDVSFEDLRTVVKAAFHMRRKTLRNGLSALAKERGLAVDDVFAAADIDPKERAEQVPVKGFLRLARALRTSA